MAAFQNRTDPHAHAKVLEARILARARMAEQRVRTPEEVAGEDLRVSNPIIPFPVADALSMRLVVGGAELLSGRCSLESASYGFPSMPLEYLAEGRVASAIGISITDAVRIPRGMWARALSQVGLQAKTEASLCSIVIVPATKGASACQLSWVVPNDTEYPTYLKETFSSPLLLRRALHTLLIEPMSGSSQVHAVATLLAQHVFLPMARALQIAPVRVTVREDPSADSENGTEWSKVSPLTQISVLDSFRVFDLSSDEGRGAMRAHVFGHSALPARARKAA